MREEKRGAVSQEATGRDDTIVVLNKCLKLRKT